MFQGFKSIWSKTVSSLRAIAGARRKIHQLEESLLIIQERNKIDTARILHRLDSLTRHIDNSKPAEQRSNVFTLLQHAEIASLIGSADSRRTFSQYGEDKIFQLIFDCLEISKPFFFDIGAHHPAKLSNTAVFYEQGSCGVNVEANPHYITSS